MDCNRFRKIARIRGPDPPLSELKTPGPRRARLNVLLKVAGMSAQTGLATAPESRMEVVTRVLRLGHVLEQMDAISQRAERRRPVGDAQSFPSWNIGDRDKRRID